MAFGSKSSPGEAIASAFAVVGAAAVFAAAGAPGLEDWGGAGVPAGAEVPGEAGIGADCAAGGGTAVPVAAGCCAIAVDAERQKRPAMPRARIVTSPNLNDTAPVVSVVYGRSRVRAQAKDRGIACLTCVQPSGSRGSGFETCSPHLVSRKSSSAALNRVGSCRKAKWLVLGRIIRPAPGIARAMYSVCSRRITSS